MFVYVLISNNKITSWNSIFPKNTTLFRSSGSYSSWKFIQITRKVKMLVSSSNASLWKISKKLMELEHIRISKPGHEDEETESPSRTEEVILLSCAFTRRALPFRVERTRRIDQKTKKRHPSLPDNLFLAVMTDTGHLLSDVAGLGVSLLAIKVSSWEANPRNTSGFKRLKVLAAFLSVQLVCLVSRVIIYEVIQRLLSRSWEDSEIMFGFSWTWLWSFG